MTCQVTDVPSSCDASTIPRAPDMDMDWTCRMIDMVIGLFSHAQGQMDQYSPQNIENCVITTKKFCFVQFTNFSKNLIYHYLSHKNVMPDLNQLK